MVGQQWQFTHTELIAFVVSILRQCARRESVRQTLDVRACLCASEDSAGGLGALTPDPPPPKAFKAVGPLAPHHPPGLRRALQQLRPARVVPVRAGAHPPPAQAPASAKPQTRSSFSPPRNESQLNWLFLCQVHVVGEK